MRKRRIWEFGGRNWKRLIWKDSNINIKIIG
jgi:hypothetical protein